MYHMHLFQGTLLSTLRWRHCRQNSLNNDATNVMEAWLMTSLANIVTQHGVTARNTSDVEAPYNPHQYKVCIGSSPGTFRSNFRVQILSKLWGLDRIRWTTLITNSSIQRTNNSVTIWSKLGISDMCLQQSLDTTNLFFNLLWGTLWA